MARRQPGRPSKLTPERQERIIELIRAGNYMEIAAQAAGINVATMYRWLQRGEETNSGKYHEFREAIMRARAEAEARNVTLIQTAARADWRAAAWFLERSFPDRWGGKQVVEHSGKLLVVRDLSEVTPVDGEG